MKAVDSLNIPAHGTLVLEPNGNHLMVTGLKEHPKEGTQVDFTIKLEPGGSRDPFEDPRFQISRKMNLLSPKNSVSPTPLKKPSSSNWWLLIAAIPILAAIGVLIPLAMKQHAKEGFFGTRMFPLKTAYDFKLGGPNSADFRLDQFHGKAVLFIFGFTHCANVCPTSLTNLASIYQALTPAERKQVQILFISVDPKGDTPQMLQRYVTSFDPPFIGLTGSKAAIAQTVRTYGASYEMVAGSTNQPNDYSVNHSAYLYLINPAGTSELLHDNEKLADIHWMVGDIRAVLQERAPR